MELIDALNWRYAAKRMNGEKVPQEKVDNILEAIRLTATSLGLQPYRVFVLESKEIREKLHEKANPQPQIVEGSHVIVFASMKNITEAYVDEFIGSVSKVRGASMEQLAPYKDMINGFLTSREPEVIQQWIIRQAYIGLGTGIIAAAMEKVDATPMEGFDPAEVDKILGLEEKNLKSVVMLALGYRDEENDYLAKAEKVRLSKEELYTIL